MRRWWLVLALLGLGRAQETRDPFDLIRQLAGKHPLGIADRKLLRSGEHYPEHEPLLSPRIRQALDDPLAVPGTGLALLRSLKGDGLAIAAYLQWSRRRKAGVEDADDPYELEGLDAIGPQAKRGVTLIHRGVTLARKNRDAAFAKLTDEERAHLREWLPKWISRTTPEDAKRAQAGEEDVATREGLMRCATLWGKVDEDALDTAWATLAASVEQALPLLRHARPFRKTIRRKDVILAGQGSGRVPADAPIIIDFGGDDEYRITKDTPRYPVQVILELGGNDLYLSQRPHTWGSTLLGVSLHLDLSGDDDYRGKDWTLGCGLGGHAALIDRAGRDRYYGGLGSQGVGIFGTGSLIDEAGDDEYVASCFAQGFGSTAGLGTLYDGAGDDTYMAGRDEEDIWRRPGTYVTFAQGCAYSHRFGRIWIDETKQRRWKVTGQIPGGIGVLIDRDGNDRYEADVFGQGAGYWYSLGLLVDGGGNDRYRTTWYGQGVGTHAAVGCLVDVAGNDWYFSRNTSQGCGHDFSAGLLHDLAGNDTYVGVSLCQGAGNARSGLGVLVDEAGDDSYRCQSNAWGFGQKITRNPTAAPFGFFLDLGGKNHYQGWPKAGAKPGTRWRQPPRGFGVDGK